MKLNKFKLIFILLNLILTSMVFLNPTNVSAGYFSISCSRGCQGQTDSTVRIGVSGITGLVEFHRFDTYYGYPAGPLIESHYVPTSSWFELDLSTPSTPGGWSIFARMQGSFSNIIFSINIYELVEYPISGQVTNEYNNGVQAEISIVGSGISYSGSTNSNGDYNLVLTKQNGGQTEDVAVEYSRTEYGNVYDSLTLVKDSTVTNDATIRYADFEFNGDDYLYYTRMTHGLHYPPMAEVGYILSTRVTDVHDITGSFYDAGKVSFETNFAASLNTLYLGDKCTDSYWHEPTYDYRFDKITSYIRFKNLGDSEWRSLGLTKIEDEHVYFPESDSSGSSYTDAFVDILFFIAGQVVPGKFDPLLAGAQYLWNLASQPPEADKTSYGITETPENLNTPAIYVTRDFASPSFNEYNLGFKFTYDIGWEVESLVFEVWHYAEIGTICSNGDTPPMHNYYPGVYSIFVGETFTINRVPT